MDRMRADNLPISGKPALTLRGPAASGKDKCKLKMDATVTAHPDTNHWWNVPETHEVYVQPNGYRSNTNTLITWGNWAADDSGWVAAHETGHLMGLNDQYTDQYNSQGDLVSVPKPGWKTR